MRDVNWWLMAIAFVLGVVLTLALTIRRVKREVAVSAATGSAWTTGMVKPAPRAVKPTPTAAAAGAASAGGANSAAGAAVAAGAAGAVGASKLVGTSTTESSADPNAQADLPYGVGSARSGLGGVGPSGWTVKGNEDSMLYHTPDSPSYHETIAEIWFQDEESATRGGFSPWHKGQRSSGSSGVATLVETVEGPYGRGSAAPGVGGAGPSGWAVKGNGDSMLYHTPDSPSYEQTIAEVWFIDEQAAVRCGFSPWHKGRTK